MEAGERPPIVGVVIDVDGRSVVFVAAHVEGLLAQTQRPIVVEPVLDVEKVGVVEEFGVAFDGDDALADEVGDVVADLTAEQEVEVVAVEAVVVLRGFPMRRKNPKR